MLGSRQYAVPSGNQYEIPVTRETIGVHSKVGEDRDRLPSVWERLDELDVCLQQLDEQLQLLSGRLDGVTTRKEKELYPVPGPRVTDSALDGRVCNQSDFVDELIRRVQDLRESLTV